MACLAWPKRSPGMLFEFIINIGSQRLCYYSVRSDLGKQIWFRLKPAKLINYSEFPNHLFGNNFPAMQHSFMALCFGSALMEHEEEGRCSVLIPGNISTQNFICQIEHATGSRRKLDKFIWNCDRKNKSKLFASTIETFCCAFKAAN